jgi:hypothetical protein
MQYTATSFVRTYRKLAAPVLLVHRKNVAITEIFPHEKRIYETHPEDALEVDLINKPINLLQRFLSFFRFIQNGKIQYYLLYGLVFYPVDRSAELEQNDLDYASPDFNIDSKSVLWRDSYKNQEHLCRPEGPGIFQPLKDIWRLFRKGAVFSDTATVVTRIAPSIYFASVLLAVGCIPFGNDKGLFSFQGDFVFFAYGLALGKFFMIIAALDTGSSFEGMGASREAHFSMLAEPAFFGVIGSWPYLPEGLRFKIFLPVCILVTTCPMCSVRLC